MWHKGGIFPKSTFQQLATIGKTNIYNFLGEIVTFRENPLILGVSDLFLELDRYFVGYFSSRDITVLCRESGKTPPKATEWLPYA